jgi:hypothetical protein
MNISSNEKLYGNISLQRRKRSVCLALEHTDDDSHVLVYRVRLNKSETL